MSGNVAQPAAEQCQSTNGLMMNPQSEMTIVNPIASIPAKETSRPTSKTRKRPATTSGCLVTRSQQKNRVQIQNVASTIAQLAPISSQTMIPTLLDGTAIQSRETSQLSVITTSTNSHPLSSYRLDQTRSSAAEDISTHENLQVTDDNIHYVDSNLLLGKLFDHYISPTFVDQSPIERAIRAQYYRTLTLELTAQASSQISYSTPENLVNNFLDSLRKLKLISS